MNSQRAVASREFELKQYFSHKICFALITLSLSNAKPDDPAPLRPLRLPGGGVSAVRAGGDTGGEAGEDGDPRCGGNREDQEEGRNKNAFGNEQMIVSN